MKVESRFSSVILLLGAWLCLAGCTSSDGGAYNLLLEQTSAVFDATGGTRTIAIIPADGHYACQAEDVAEWFSARVEGNKIIVTAEPNYSESERRGAIEVSYPNSDYGTATLSVLQEGAAELQIESSAATQYTLDSEGGRCTFGVKSNYAYELVTTSEWVVPMVDAANGTATFLVEKNLGDAARTAHLTLRTVAEAPHFEQQITITQGSRAENEYFKFVGKWVITATKWYYSPNGSLNVLDVTPDPASHYLIFDIEECEYGKSFMMRNFLYPGTRLEVRYDAAQRAIIIPFGWSVMDSYDVFLYVTLVGTSQFSYGSLEVAATMMANNEMMTLDLPKASSFTNINDVGFGLWTYSDNGGKQALGSRAYPTMFPMGDIKFVKNVE